MEDEGWGGEVQTDMLWRGLTPGVIAVEVEELEEPVAEENGYKEQV